MDDHLEFSITIQIKDCSKIVTFGATDSSGFA